MSERYYIVYLNHTTNGYDEPVGGYYVGYKDKCSDKFSEMYIDAKRYKSLTAAFTRLNFEPRIVPINDMLKKFETNHILRQKKLNRLFDKDNSNLNYDSVIPFSLGRIDIIEITGNNIAYLGEIDKLELYDIFLGYKKRLDAKYRNNMKSNDPEWEKNRIKIEIGNINDDFWN